MAGSISERRFMFTKLKQLFRNIEFQKKIIGISVVISLIPISLLGLFSYTRMRTLLVEREKTALQETLQQEVTQLNYKTDF